VRCASGCSKPSSPGCSRSAPAERRGEDEFHRLEIRAHRGGMIAEMRLR